MKSMQPTQSLFIATIYRPPGPYTAFLTEFPEFLLDLVVIADPLQKGFRSHHRLSGFCPTRLWTYSLSQSYSGPSLSHGINVVDLNFFPHNPGLSEHHFITFTIATNNLLRPQPRSIKSRAINSQTTQRFLNAFPDSLCLPKDIREQKSVTHLTEELNLTLHAIP